MLFADDTSVLISSRNFKVFRSVTDLLLSHMNKWFATNLVLNLDKSNKVEFIA
jgi:hypothetical protein